MEGAGELSTLATFHTSPPISPPSQLLSSPLHSQRYSASSVPSPARKPGLAQLGNHHQRQVRRIAVRSSSFDFTDVIWDPEALLIRSDDGNCTPIVGPSQRFSFTETQIAQIWAFNGRGLSVPHGRDGKIWKCGFPLFDIQGILEYLLCILADYCHCDFSRSTIPPVVTSGNNNPAQLFAFCPSPRKITFGRIERNSWSWARKWSSSNHPK